MSRTGQQHGAPRLEAAAAPDALIRVFEAHASPPLAAFVKDFRVPEFPEAHDDAHLPDTAPVAAFTLHGGCQIDDRQWVPRCAFTGGAAGPADPCSPRRTPCAPGAL